MKISKELLLRLESLLASIEDVDVKMSRLQQRYNIDYSDAMGAEQRREDIDKIREMITDLKTDED